VRATAAYYELSCTGDAQRASQLLRDVDLGRGLTVLVARAAARAERDYERLLELTDFPTTGNTLLLPVWDLLDRYDALNHLGLEADAENTLDKAGNLLVELEKEGDVIDDIYYPSTKAWYYSLRGDVGATRQWLEDDSKKAKEPNSYHFEIHLIRAEILARIGREIDAIEELRRMLERPGNGTFQYFDLMPQFDNLKENPGYEALRMEFGDAHWNATSSLR
jgi:tetratricopeptide (TPR) repeat protein